MAKLVLVAGPGHAHNEFVAYLLNNNRAGKHDCPLLWEFYPGPFGTFIRHCEDWNTIAEYPEYTKYYDNELRNGADDSNTTRAQFDSLVEEVGKLYTDDTVICQYVNCLNADEVVSWANEVNISVVSSLIDLTVSDIRSHYVQMEFSIGAAADVDYDEIKFDIEEVCRWLYSKHYQHIALTESSTDIHFFDINKLFDSNKSALDKYITFVYNKLSLSPTYINMIYNNISQFKEINQPAHPLMKQINEMSWDEIVAIAKGTK